MSRPLRQTCGVGELGPKMQAAEMRVSLFMKWNTNRNGKGVDRNYTKLKLEKAKDYKGQGLTTRTTNTGELGARRTRRDRDNRYKR